MAKLGRDGTAGSSTGGSRASMTAGKAKAVKKNAASKFGTGMMTPPVIKKGKVKDFNKNSIKAVVDGLYGTKTTPKQFKNIIKEDKKQSAKMDAMNYPTVKTPKVPVKKR